MDYANMLLYVVVSTFTPGPNNLMAMYQCAQNGIAGSLKYLIGATIGFTSLFILCGVLNLGISSIIPDIEPYMRWFGAGYMIYLAIVILRKRNKSNDVGSGKSNSLISGFLLQYVNVKGWFFGLTVFSIYVTPFNDFIIPTIGFGLLFSLICAIAMFIWAVSGATLKNVFTKYETLVNIMMAVLLVYCAYSIWK